MRWLVLGATGRTGREVVDQALRRGHATTAYVRSPGKLAPRAGLTVVQGDPLDPRALERALPGHDAVISALGPSPREALQGTTLLTDAAASTVAAMVAAGVPRIALVSAAILFPEPSGFPYDLLRWLLARHGRDLATAEAVLSGSDLQWTVVRPPRIAGRDRRYRVEVGALPSRGTVISYPALGAALVDLVERGAHLGQVVGVAR